MASSSKGAMGDGGVVSGNQDRQNAWTLVLGPCGVLALRNPLANEVKES